MSNDSPIATDLNGFQRALKELKAQDSSADIQWRCHAGLLALGHNVAAWAEPSTVLSMRLNSSPRFFERTCMGLRRLPTTMRR